MCFDVFYHKTNMLSIVKAIDFFYYNNPAQWWIG